MTTISVIPIYFFASIAVACGLISCDVISGFLKLEKGAADYWERLQFLTASLSGEFLRQIKRRSKKLAAGTFRRDDDFAQLRGKLNLRWVLAHEDEFTDEDMPVLSHAPFTKPAAFFRSPAARQPEAALHPTEEPEGAAVAPLAPPEPVEKQPMAAVSQPEPQKLVVERLAEIIPPPVPSKPVLKQPVTAIPPQEKVRLLRGGKRTKSKEAVTRLASVSRLDDDRQDEMVETSPPERAAVQMPDEENGESGTEENIDGRDASERLSEIPRMSEEEMDSLAGREKAPGVVEKSRCKVLVFMHVTGGAGATTLAVNTAYALAEANPRRGCCLLDLDVQFGGVASLLDLPYSSAVQALIEDPSRLYRLLFEDMLVRHPTGIHVLTAPRFPVPLHAFETNTISDLLWSAKMQFSHVVVDMPVALTTWTDVVLRMATMIYLVTPITVPAAQMVVRFLNLLHQQELGHLPVKIVVNRYNSSSIRSNSISLKQFNKAIGRPIDHLIPNEYELILQSHNQGTPAIRLAPKSRFSQAITKMLVEDIGGYAPAAQPQRKYALFDRS